MLDKEVQTAQSLFFAGEVVAAEKAFRKIMNSGRRNARVLNDLGVVCHSQGKLEEAKALLLEASTLDPNNLDAILNLSHLYETLGKLEQAAVYRNKAKAIQRDRADSGHSGEEKEPQKDPSYMNLQEWLELALDFHRAGRFKKAGSIYRKILQEDGTNADACHLLGLVAYQEGDYDRALDLIEKAVEQCPRTAVFWNNLGNVLKEKGRMGAAVEAYREALALEPGYVDVHCNLGLMYRGQGALDQALMHYKSAIRIDPNDPQAYNEIGCILKSLGRVEEAITCLEMALYVNREYAQAHGNLGLCFELRGDLDTAVYHCEEAIRLHPAFPEAFNNLGNALKRKGQTERAVRYYQKALQIKPDFAEAHNNLGNMLMARGDTEPALRHLHKAIKFKPNMAEAHNNLGNAMLAFGKVEEALEAFKKALEIDPRLSGVRSNFLFNLHYRSTDRAFLFQEHKRWADYHAQGSPAAMASPMGRERSNRRLRIGYVSPDFCFHPVAFFLEPVLKHRNEHCFEIFCYSDVSKPDAKTKVFRELTDHWRDISRMSDEQVTDSIHKDRIDILVDLAGHSTNNRLPVFASKPAPVQVNYLGYPDTTGLPTIDYRITDGYADPPGKPDLFHVERLVRLPVSFLCYEPPQGLPSIGEPPSTRSDKVTFGCFNNMLKISSETVSAWSDILREMPSSTLILKSRQFVYNEARDGLLEMFYRYGIEAGRIEMLGRIDDFFEHLSLYNRIDIALDPFPYNGTATTCEALFMGVPVIVLEGNGHVSRVGVSIVSNVGLPYLIADTVEAYKAKAVKLARDSKILTDLRRRLRGMMAESPLTDVIRRARDIEEAYLNMWQGYPGRWECTPEGTFGVCSGDRRAEGLDEFGES